MEITEDTVLECIEMLLEEAPDLDQNFTTRQVLDLLSPADGDKTKELRQMETVFLRFRLEGILEETSEGFYLLKEPPVELDITKQ